MTRVYISNEIQTKTNETMCVYQSTNAGKEKIFLSEIKDIVKCLINSSLLPLT